MTLEHYYSESLCLVLVSANLRVTMTIALAQSGTFQSCFFAGAPSSASLHPQHSSSLDEALASGRLVHMGLQLWGSTHPQSSGDGISIATLNVFPQQCPPWYTALFICCPRRCHFGLNKSFYPSSVF